MESTQTDQTAGCQGKNVEVHQDTIDTIANISNTTIADREYMALLKKIVSHLTEEFTKTQEKLVAALTALAESNKKIKDGTKPSNRVISPLTWMTVKKNSKFLANLIHHEEISKSSPENLTNFTNPLIYNTGPGNDTFTFKEANSQPNMLDFVEFKIKGTSYHVDDNHWKMVSIIELKGGHTIISICNFKRNRVTDVRFIRKNTACVPMGA